MPWRRIFRTGSGASQASTGEARPVGETADPLRRDWGHAGNEGCTVSRKHDTKKLRLLLIVLLGLGVAGAALDATLARPVWSAMRARQPALRLESAGAGLGQGVTLALLGGFRALVADVTWLRMYVLWERRDLPGCEALLRLVGMLDPRPMEFWLNGARIFAYDFPAWRIESAGGYDRVPVEVQGRIEREQALLALRHLDAAMQFHPESAELWIERGSLQLNRLREVDAAAESFRRAWEQPRAPYYAARLYAELLRRMGRKAEALAFLLTLHPILPAADEGAAADRVFERIQELERELGVPADRAYRPSGDTR